MSENQTPIQDFIGRVRASPSQEYSALVTLKYTPEQGTPPSRRNSGWRKLAYGVLERNNIRVSSTYGIAPKSRRIALRTRGDVILRLVGDKDVEAIVENNLLRRATPPPRT